MGHKKSRGRSQRKEGPLRRESKVTYRKFKLPRPLTGEGLGNDRLDVFRKDCMTQRRTHLVVCPALTLPPSPKGPPPLLSCGYSS